MKILKKSLLLFLSFCIICSFFAACNGGSGNSGGNESTVSVEYSTADINFVDANGDPAYRVVRSAASDELASYASTIIKAIKDKFDVSVKQTTDAESEEGFSEIVIGDSTREVTAKAKQALRNETTGRKDDYIICSIGDDIAIYGMSLEATIAGIEYFASAYITGETIVGGIHYVNNNSSDFTDISIAGTTRLSDFTLVRPIYNVSYITQIQTDALLEFIATKTGYSIPQVNDNIASTTGNISDGSGTLTPTTPTEYEIIIGNATRDGVKAITDYNSYEIRVEGKKVYLNGGSAHATAMAVSEFKKLLENNTAITADMNVTAGDYNSAAANYDAATYYKPTWGDDFDGEDINYDIWNVNWDVASSYSGAANGKAQYRGSTMLKNNYVKDGLMYQVAVETDTAYYGGWFDTERKMNYLYGYLELSTIHPKGMGFWTALWTVSQCQDYPEFADYWYNSETDVEECYGPGTWVYGNTFAWPTSAGRLGLELDPDDQGTVHVNNKLSAKDDRGFYLDFHTFGYEWNGNTNVKFTCDGYVYVDQDLREGAEQMAYEIPQLIRLSLACGSGNHGEPTTDPVEWTNYNKFIVDWVRLYQLKGQKLYNWSNQTGGYVVVSE